MEIKLEICVDSLESARIAERGGADRLELCGELNVGGLTPSFGLLEQCFKKISIPINVMIRPRSGDFSYTEDEFATMLNDIILIKKYYPKVNGFVLGVLTDSNEIDVERMAEIIELSAPIPITIHRAFDMTSNMNRSLDICLSLGIERILTAGFKNKAFEGIENLNELISLSDDNIKIMPGSGLHSKNVGEFLKNVHPIEIHMSAKKSVELTIQADEKELQIGRDDRTNELQRYIADFEEIKEVKKILREFVESK